MTDEPSTENEAPQPGDVFTWVLSPGSLVKVLSVGRENAKVRVTMPNGGSWLKVQPMPFPPAFMRVTPPAKPQETP